MGQITDVLFAPHTPRIHSSEFRDREPWSLMTDALAQMSRDVRALDIDAIVVVSVHWITTFPIYVKSGSRHAGCLTAPEAPDLIKDVGYDFAGNHELALGLVKSGVDRGLFVREAAAESLVVDYGTVEPLRHLYGPDGGSAPAIVPTSVCMQSDAAECLTWGAVIAQAVAESPLRVAMLVSGSMTHKLVRQPEKWPDPEHRAMDDKLIELMLDGRLEEFIAFLDEVNKSVEVEMSGRHLLTAAGAMSAGGTWRGQLYGYGPSSGSGNPIMRVWRTDTSQP